MKSSVVKKLEARELEPPPREAGMPLHWRLRLLGENAGALLLFLFAAGLFVGQWMPWELWGTHLPIDAGLDSRLIAFQVWSLQTNLTGHPSGLFDSLVFYPMQGSLLTVDPLLAFVVVSLPARLLGASSVTTFYLGTWFWVALNGWAMWWAIRRLTGDAMAGLLPAVCWALTPYVFGNLPRTHLLPHWAWPLIVCHLILHLEDHSRSRAVGIGFLLAAAVSMGWYAAALTLLMMVCWVVAVLLTSKFQPGKQWIGGMALAAVFPAAVLAPLAWVYAGNLEFAIPQTDIALRTRFRPWELLTPWSGSATGWLFTKLGVPLVSPRWLSTGWVLLVVVIAGAVMTRRRAGGLGAWYRWHAPTMRSTTAFLVLLALVALVLAQGPRAHVMGHDILLPLGWIVWLVPDLSFFRTISSLSMMPLLALCFCGGLLLATWRVNLLKPWEGPAVIIALTALGFLDIFPMHRHTGEVIPITPVVHAIAGHERINAIAETPLRTPQDRTDAMLRATVHRRRVHDGQSDVAVRDFMSLSDALARFPDPVAEAAFIYLNVDALLVRPGAFDPPLEDVPPGWIVLEQDDMFWLLARPDFFDEDDAEEAEEEELEGFRLHETAAERAERERREAEAAAQLAARDAHWPTTDSLQLIADMLPPEEDDLPWPIELTGADVLDAMWIDAMIRTGPTTVRTEVDAKAAWSFEKPIDTRLYRKVVLRMRALSSPTRHERVQLFWRGPKFPGETEGRSMSQPLQADGQWQRVVFDLTDHPMWVWSGGVTTLRIDVANQANVEIEWDLVRVE